MVQTQDTEKATILHLKCMIWKKSFFNTTDIYITISRSLLSIPNTGGPIENL